MYLVAEVRLQDGENIENALRRFKRKVQQEDIIKEVKKHSFYLKPGEKKRIKQSLARKRSRKKSGGNPSSSYSRNQIREGCLKSPSLDNRSRIVRFRVLDRGILGWCRRCISCDPNIPRSAGC